MSRKRILTAITLFAAMAIAFGSYGWYTWNNQVYSYTQCYETYTVTTSYGWPPPFPGTCVLNSWTGTVIVSSAYCPMLSSTITCNNQGMVNYYTLTTVSGNYELHFTDGVPLPNNGQRITVYGTNTSRIGTCSTPAPLNCVVGDIRVVSWQTG
jgi:hypothetical protein